MMSKANANKQSQKNVFDQRICLDKENRSSNYERVNQRRSFKNKSWDGSMNQRWQQLMTKKHAKWLRRIVWLWYWFYGQWIGSFVDSLASHHHWCSLWRFNATRFKHVNKLRNVIHANYPTVITSFLHLRSLRCYSYVLSIKPLRLNISRLHCKCFQFASFSLNEP